MTDDTIDKVYDLFLAIQIEAGQLEAKMGSARRIIGDRQMNFSKEPRYLQSLADYFSREAKGYATGMQELCRLIKECHEVLPEGNQS